VILTSAKIDESMGSMGMSVLNRKFSDYSVIVYRFVPFFKKNAFSDLPHTSLYALRCIN